VYAKQFRDHSSGYQGNIKQKFPTCCTPSKDLPVVHRWHAASTVTILLQQRAMPMKTLGATAVAAVALYVADQFLDEGRYSAIVADALKQVGQLVGINV
jgi:hypothetical protein